MSRYWRADDFKDYDARLIRADLTVVYTKAGFYHRLDGPAVIKADGKRSYWISGDLFPYEVWKTADPVCKNRKMLIKSLINDEYDDEELP